MPTYIEVQTFYIFYCPCSLFCDRCHFIVETVFLPLVLVSFLLFQSSDGHKRLLWDSCLTLIHSYRFFVYSCYPASSDLTLSSSTSIVAISMAKLNIGIFIPLSSLCYCQESFTCYCGWIASLTKPPAIFLFCFTSNFSAKSHHFSHCKAIMQHSLSCYGTFHSDQWRSWHNLPFFLMLGIKRVLHRYPWCCPMSAISSSNIKIDCITSKNYRYEEDWKFIRSYRFRW